VVQLREDRQTVVDPPDHGILELRGSHVQLQLIS
jgi:hypothetical protein